MHKQQRGKKNGSVYRQSDESKPVNDTGIGQRQLVSIAETKRDSETDPSQADGAELIGDDKLSSHKPNLRLEWWEADRLQAHPQNWRRHPARQREAVARLLQEVGWAGALLYNERTGRLLDGHLRKELCRGQRVPVLVGSWSQQQERQILALLDPLTALAEPDAERWQELLRELQDVDERLAQTLDALAQKQGLSLPAEILETADAARSEASLPEARFEVIVECEDETSQRQLYERLTTEGFRCRVLTF